MAQRILIIDDDPINVKILGDFLSRKGFEVDRASDGEAALSQAHQNRPDLVLLDVLLPKINGLDLCRRLKAAPHAPPVFLMSAVYRSSSIQKDARSEYGADAYFVKPFRVQDLWREIEGRLDCPPPAERGAPLEGDLGGVGLARVLVTLAAADETGALEIGRGSLVRWIYLDRGTPVAVEAMARAESFDQFLLDQGIGPGEATEPDLRARLERRYVEERLLACFLTRQGNFRFLRGQTPAEGTPRAEMPLPVLVLEGVRRHVSLVELAAEVERIRGRIMHVTPSAPTLLLGVRLGEEQSRVLGAIDGSSTAEEVVARSGVPAESGMQTLFGLMLLGAAAVEETAGNA